MKPTLLPHARLALATGVVFVLTLAGARSLWAQDYAPSLTFANPILLGPSFAGLVEGRAGADFSHRIRRATDQDNFTTSVLTVDYPLDLKRFVGGAGLILASDNAGGLRTNQAHLALSYEVPKPARIRYHHLRVGFQAGIFQRTLQSANLVFADQFSALINNFDFTRQSQDPLANQGLSTPLAFDAALSLLFYRTQKIKGNPELNYYLGGSYHHFNRPSIGFNPSDRDVFLSPRTTIYGGLKYRTRSIVDVNLNAIYSEQNASQLLTVGVFARVVFYERNVLFSNESASLIAGVNLRQQLNSVRVPATLDNPATLENEESFTTVRRSGLESMVPYIGLEYNKSFSFAVAYDQVLASQNTLTSSFGGLMFMASYVFGSEKYKKPALPFPLF